MASRVASNRSAKKRCRLIRAPSNRLAGAVTANKRWISAAWGTSDNNRRAKFYSLTKAGGKHWRRELGANSAVIGRILGMESLE